MPIPVYAARAARIAQIATEYRHRLGDGLLDACERTGMSLVGIFEAVETQDWERPAFHPSGIKTVRQLLSLRIVELSVHGWEALRRAGLPDGSHEVIIDWLPTRLRLSFSPRSSVTEPLRYLFVLGPPQPGRVRVTISGNRIDFDTVWDEGDADVVLTLDAETYVLLLMGRLGWQQTLDTGAVTITGHRELALEFPSWFGLT